MTEQEILSEIRERLARIEERINNQSDLRGEVEALKTKLAEVDARSKSNTHRIDKLEANSTWLWRTIAGAIIVASVGGLAVMFKKG